MAVPRNRTSNARKNSRRSHMAKTPKNTHKCSNCSRAALSHKMCPFCGHYANRVIISSGEEA